MLCERVSFWKLHGILVRRKVVEKPMTNHRQTVENATFGVEQMLFCIDSWVAKQVPPNLFRMRIHLVQHQSRDGQTGASRQNTRELPLHQNHPFLSTHVIITYFGPVAVYYCYCHLLPFISKFLSSLNGYSSKNGYGSVRGDPDVWKE